MKTFKTFAVVGLLVILLSLSVGAAEKLTGLEIVERVYNRDAGETVKATLTMTLINSRGEKRIREIQQYDKDKGGIEKKIMFFKAPEDIRNTSFMVWSYPDKDDDQWIYLPALKKIKRISSESKNDYFMGSDFTYDDLGDRRPDEDTHTLLKEEEYEGKACYVVESTPKDEDYMYSKTTTWIAKDTWIGVKKNFYDEDGELLKVLHIKKYETFDKIVIITHTEMENVQEKHKTTMELKDIELNKEISDNQFTERMMRRGL